MKLREFQAKAILAGRGFAIPPGGTARTPREARQIADDLRTPVVLKPQLGVKQRGKRGVIAFCDDGSAAESEAGRLFGLAVAGEAIQTILVEQQVDVAAEHYVAVTVDSARRCPVIMASREGGVEIEELARDTPERILQLPVDILAGLTDQDRETLGGFVGGDVAAVASTLYSLFREYDAELVEINPLVRTTEGRLLAVDAVLNVNDAALFRQPAMALLKGELGGDPVAAEADANRWTFIDLPGDVAILSSGAGLTMAILDLLQRAGGSAANFLDTAQIDERGIYDAFALLAKAKRARAMLVNIFAGLNRCDRLAEGIVRYLVEHSIDIPIVVRMVGNAEGDGHRILRESGIEPYRRLEDAVERVVALAGPRG